MTYIKNNPLSASLIFLYLYMGYIFLMLNQHFGIPLKFIPGFLFLTGFLFGFLDQNPLS